MAAARAAANIDPGVERPNVKVTRLSNSQPTGVDMQVDTTV